MSAHNTPFDNFTNFTQGKDPGNGGTFQVDRSPLVLPIVSAAAETRTLPRPTRAGCICVLHHRTDGGDVTVTVTGGYDEAGTTTMVFNDAGQFAALVSLYDGTNYFWRMLGSLSGPGGTGGTVGFGPGSGGAVTQITTAATGVTLNKPSGQITTVAQNIAAAGEVQFTVTNSYVAATDAVVVNVASGTVGGTTIAAVTAVAAGSFQVTLTNLHATVAETGVLVLNFAVIKGQAA